jgi:5-methylcytosine-specific restriction enzyme A
MCANKINDEVIEKKKQEIIDFIISNFDVTSRKGVNNKYQSRYITSRKHEEDFPKQYWRKADFKSNPRWIAENPKVWINIHSIDDKSGRGLKIQIRCNCDPWLGGRSNDKERFAEKWGFPLNNKNIKYIVSHGNLLDLSVVNDEILTFNPSKEYFSHFLNEAYKIYDPKYSRSKNENVNDNTHKKSNFSDLIQITVTTKDIEKSKAIKTQEEIEDFIYQKEVVESVNWSKSIIFHDVPVEKPVKSDKVTSEAFKRNAQKGVNAIVKANYLCEIDANHKDFISKVTGKNYVEAHHLIPMEYQDRFDVSIDVEANIICLCVACHKKLHHAVFEEKEAILKQLLNMRKARLQKCSINVTGDVLLTYYENSYISG